MALAQHSLMKIDEIDLITISHQNLILTLTSVLGSKSSMVVDSVMVHYPCLFELYIILKVSS